MENHKHEYSFKILNGRVKIYIDGYVCFCFNQLDFKGYYAYKDDQGIWGLDVYLIASDSGGKHTMEIYFKTKQTWLDVLELLDKNM